jgi:hypothetical protein
MGIWARQGIEGLYEDAYITPEATPWCTHGASPHGDRKPLAWCACGTGPYTTLSVMSTGTAPCAYSSDATKLPTVTWTALTTTIATPKTTQPTPKPTNPSPPTPNKSTEKVKCGIQKHEAAFDIMPYANRAAAITVIEKFCSLYEGKVMGGSDGYTYLSYENQEILGEGNNWPWTVIASVTVINGCQFTIDGGSRSDECGRIFRRTFDECDTDGVNYKEGGMVTSNCAKYVFLPGWLPGSLY